MADSKISGLPVDTSLEGDELVPIVDDPSTAPTNKSVTVTTLLAAGSATYVSAVVVPTATGVVATDWANIVAAQARAALILATGGQPLVTFPGCPWNGSTLTPYALGSNTLVPVSGVDYIGVPPLLYPTATPGSATGPAVDWAFQGGTVLSGDGTARGIAAFATDAGSMASGWQTNCLRASRIYGFGLQNFTDGLKLGADNVLGTFGCEIDEIYARNCSGWGVDIVNPMLTEIGTLWASLCQNGVRVEASMPSATFIPGNSTVGRIFVSIPQDGRDNRMCRGVRVQVNNAGSSASAALNEMRMGTVQVNAFNVAALTVTATLTGGSPNIAVPDASKFATGFLCQFTTSASGFTTNRYYVVASVDTGANTITLAASRSSTAVTPGSNGTPTLRTYGYASVDIGPTSGGTGQATWYLENTVIDQFDTEGTKVGIFAENLLGVNYTQCNVPSSPLPAVVARKCGNGVWRLISGGDVDFDGTSAVNVQVTGRLATLLNSTPPGHWYDDANARWVIAAGLSGGVLVGESATAKVGFFGTAPVVQPTAVTPKAALEALGLGASLIDILASAALTGTPTAPTAAQGTNTTQVATTAYVQTEVGLLVPNSLVDAKGDLLIGTADNTLGRHAAGNDGEVPLWDAAATDGVRNAVLNAPKRYNDLLACSIDDPACNAAAGTVLPAAATLFLVRIPLLRQLSVTNVRFRVEALAGNTLTDSFVALFKSDGTIIGQTADQSAVWGPVGGGGVTGTKSVALASGPFTVTPLAANDFVWAAFYCGTAAGTLPSFTRAGSNSTLINMGIVNVNRSRAGQIAQADTATLATIVPANILQTNAIVYVVGLT